MTATHPIDIDTITFESTDVNDYQVKWHPRGATFRVLIDTYGQWSECTVGTLYGDNGGDPPDLAQAYAHAIALLTRAVEGELADDR